MLPAIPAGSVEAPVGLLWIRYASVACRALQNDLSRTVKMSHFDDWVCGGRRGSLSSPTVIPEAQPMLPVIPAGSVEAPVGLLWIRYVSVASRGLQNDLSRTVKMS